MSSHEMMERGPAPEAVRWTKPSLEEERGELERTAEALGVELDRLISAYEQAGMEDLSDDDWDRLRNADSRDRSWTRQEIKERAADKGRDLERILEGLKAGQELPTPVILFRAHEDPYLIAGNTRLLACRTADPPIRPKILAMRIVEG